MDAFERVIDLYERHAHAWAADRGRRLGPEKPWLDPPNPESLDRLADDVLGVLGRQSRERPTDRLLDLASPRSARTG